MYWYILNVEVTEFDYRLDVEHKRKRGTNDASKFWSKQQDWVEMLSPKRY